MPKADSRTLRERIAANKRNVSFSDAVALLESAGWLMKPPGRGSHRTFTKPGCPSIVTLKPMKGPLYIGYVTNLLRTIDDCADEDDAEDE